MNISRLINFILIISGSAIALYINSKETQNVYLLILGVFILMVGLYRLSIGIPSKNLKDDDANDYDQNLKL